MGILIPINFALSRHNLEFFRCHRKCLQVSCYRVLQIRISNYEKMHIIDNITFVLYNDIVLILFTLFIYCTLYFYLIFLNIHIYSVRSPNEIISLLQFMIKLDRKDFRLFVDIFFPNFLCISVKIQSHFTEYLKKGKLIFARFREMLTAKQCCIWKIYINQIILL